MVDLNNDDIEPLEMKDNVDPKEGQVFTVKYLNEGDSERFISIDVDGNGWHFSVQEATLIMMKLAEIIDAHG